MGHHEEDEYTYYQGPRRRVRKKFLFKEILVKNLSNLGKEMDTKI